MSEAEREKWAVQARELQKKVDAAHERALKAADAKERAAQVSLQAARAELHQAARAAHDAGFTEARIASVINRSGTAVHFAVTKTVPAGPDPTSQRRAAVIRRRLKGEKRR
jgi:hypothetical protein